MLRPVEEKLGNRQIARRLKHETVFLVFFSTTSGCLQLRCCSESESSLFEMMKSRGIKAGFCVLLKAVFCGSHPDGVKIAGLQMVAPKG